MKDKKILGLDLGTNSIGWAVINANITEDNKQILTGIDCAGSRIIPMDAAQLSDFEKGNSVSQTKSRRIFRSTRRLLERFLLRRERLNRVLHILGFLPEHYDSCIDRHGKFIDNEELKLAWKKNETGHYEFIFRDSFNEMVDEFKKYQPELVANGKKIPYDWTLYYLRKKALSQKISKEELAWVLLNFNQKRGYYQLREEETKKEENKKIEYIKATVTEIEKGDKDKKGGDWYKIHLDNGLIYPRSFVEKPEWEGKTLELIVTYELEKDGSIKKDKDGFDKYKIRLPKEDDWTLIKAKTQSEILNSGKKIGEYIFDALLYNPEQKIKGKLVQTIDRKFYKEELAAILDKQIELHHELQSEELYIECINNLYKNNDSHKNNINSRGFKYLFIDDIIFYQRPLKSKKSLISNCAYESHLGFDQTTGEEKEYGIKCIAKSHPLYQEFRLWQFISNLKIYQRELKNDIDITNQLLTKEEDYTDLFDWLNEQKEIDQKKFLKYSKFGLKGKNLEETYRWNYVEDKTYPCNETRGSIIKYMKKADIEVSFLSKEIEEQLWLILYSTNDRNELEKALTTFANKHNLNEKFVDTFKNFPPFKNEYGSYSAKAIKKLLPLMRMGKYWNVNDIDNSTKNRINQLINKEYDETLQERVIEKTQHLKTIDNFKGLPLWLACYIVYGRHSEAKEITKWESYRDIDIYLNNFKQHSLHNPIVEQVVTETLRTVRDIWKQVGTIDEIHLELGREMKNNAEQRRKIQTMVQENEATNRRIKLLLSEFAKDEYEIENVRPNSPSQFEILRIYEESILNNEKNISDEIKDIINKINTQNIKNGDVRRYKLWLDQKYRSPYTGEMIPLSRLFTTDYEIEHIIPQSLYFDDSYNNKVICESAVNKLKSNKLGYQFIKENGGQIVPLGNGKKDVRVYTESEYKTHITENYRNNKAKLKRLLMDEIPDDFINRQLNDSRYISKLIKGLLSNIVRENDEQEATSKNLISCTGGITDRLKSDWGIKDIWNKIILPRYERLNQISNSNNYVVTTANNHRIPATLEGINKKRIDHRHHAMDAIVIACADRSIVNYLNNASAASNASEKRYDLQRLLCDKRTTDENGNYQWLIKKPWDTFTQDTYNTLLQIIASIKQNTRVLTKATNFYQKYDNGAKVIVRQTNGDGYAVRKSLHKDTVFGEINLRQTKTITLNEALKNPERIIEKDLRKKIKELLSNGMDSKKIKAYFESEKDTWQDINLSKIEVYFFTKETNKRYFATRKNIIEVLGGAIDVSAKKVNDIIESITDTGIQSIIRRHLEENNNDTKKAFSPDGIEMMNNNIYYLNNNTPHKPIYKVRIFEEANKFAVGETGNKKKKFVEANKGTNLFAAVYQKQDGTRCYYTLPLKDVIDRLKNKQPIAEEIIGDEKLLFVISPNQLVYLPTKEELQNINQLSPNNIDKYRIYKFVSCTGSTMFFIPCNCAQPIKEKYEFSSLNKMERALTGEMIKETCIPIRIDRLGNIELTFLPKYE